MLQTVSAPDDVIAVRITGKLEQAEIDALLDRIEARLVRDEPTHLFVEVEDYTGFGAEGLGNELLRVAGLLPKLQRFGRVAIVSDQRWIRWAAKLESAVLPRVHYETFVSSERDRALAWVRGERELPRDPAFKIIETNDPDVVGFEIDGKLSAAEMAAAADYFGGLIEKQRPLRVLGRIKELDGVDAAALADRDFIGMKRGMLDRLERYALVGGPPWLRTWVSALDAFVSIEVRHFDASEERWAWEWLGASPVSERPLVGERARRPSPAPLEAEAHS